MGFFKEIFKGFTMSSEDFIAEKNKELAIAMKEQEGLNYQRMLYYKNTMGLENLNEEAGVLLFDDRLRFSLLSNEKRDVLFKDIKSVEIMNTIQIEEKSKLGQMMVIGLFALATKRKTEEISKNKIVINVCEDGINFSIIADTIYDTIDEAKELNKVLINYRESQKEDV